MKTEKAQSDPGVHGRLNRILAGAFNGPPTPLKDIPKANGDSRAMREEKPQRRRRKGRGKPS